MASQLTFSKTVKPKRQHCLVSTKQHPGFTGWFLYDFLPFVAMLTLISWLTLLGCEWVMKHKNDQPHWGEAITGKGTNHPASPEHM